MTKAFRVLDGLGKSISCSVEKLSALGYVRCVVCSSGSPLLGLGFGNVLIELRWRARRLWSDVLSLWSSLALEIEEGSRLAGKSDLEVHRG